MLPHPLSFIADTRFFPKFPSLYRGEILVIHAARLKPLGKEPIEHLSVENVRTVLKKGEARIDALDPF